MADEVLIALVSVPDATVGRRLARLIVEERLAACVNRVPGVQSTYRWKGEVHEDAEELLVIKTSSSCGDRLRDRIVEAHPYDCPEFVLLPLAGGAPAYLDWVLDSLGGGVP